MYYKIPTRLSSRFQYLPHLNNNMQRSLRNSSISAFLALLLLTMVAAGCTDGKDMPPSALVILTWPEAGKPAGSICALDSSTGSILKETLLPGGRAKALARDPLGRYWVGYSARNGPSDNRLLLFSANLKLQKTITVGCNNPGVGIVFSSGKVFAGCTENGRTGKIVVLDQKTLSEVAIIPLGAAAKSSVYYLTALAANGDRLIISGMTEGPDLSKRYAVVSVIDPATNRLTWQSKPLAGVDVWQILPYREQFILLNVASAEQRDKSSADILLLHTDNRLERRSTLPAPLWGTVQGDSVFSFHNASHNSRYSDQKRFISSFDLQSGAQASWPLPDGFNASGLLQQEGVLFLPGKTGQPWIYRFTPANGKFSLITP
jgi:outer membrane protein assembly factor BamB